MRIAKMMTMTTAALIFAAAATDVTAAPTIDPTSAVTPGIQAPSASLLAALQDPQTGQPSQPVTQPPAKGEVELDVDVNDGGGAWYTDPVWIVIGIAALVIIVALIAMAGRGGGTTVVR
jgi:hypothetical protein